MPWFRKKSRQEPVLIEEIDLDNIGADEIPKEVFKFSSTIHTMRLNSNNLTSLPEAIYNLWNLRILELRDNDVDNLSPEISNLKNLTHLDVSKNLLSDLPTELQYCDKLVCLDFSSNPIYGFSDELTKLYQLRHLGLNDVSLYQLPRQLGRMAKLESLELRENSLSDLPDTMNHMTLLVKLDIGSNQFNKLPPVVLMLFNLEELLIDRNSLCTIPTSINNLQHLKMLDLSENRLLELPESIGELTYLTDLYLSDNHLTFLPESIGNLTRLTTLKIERNKLMILPQSMGDLFSLNELIISNNNLKILPPSLGCLGNLETLVANNNILDIIPKELGSCVKLTILSLAGNQLTTLPPEMCQLSKLKVLNIVGNRLQHLPFSMTALKNLKALWISSTQSKPLIELQTERDSKGNRLLTCIYFPQKDGNHNEKSQGLHPPKEPNLTFERKSSINFELREEIITSHPKEAAPYPKEPHINAVRRMSRELNSALSDISMEFPTSPAPAKIASQVTRRQNKEKKAVVLVRRQSLIKAMDSETSSLSSSGSCEELRTLMSTLEEESERSSTTTPSTQKKASPMVSGSEKGSLKRGGALFSTSSKDDELEDLLELLQSDEEVKQNTKKRNSKPPVPQKPISKTSSVGVVERKSPQKEPAQVNVNVQEYQSSPRSFQRQRHGSLPNINNMPMEPSMQDVINQHSVFNGRSTTVASDPYDLSASASSSRVDQWIHEQETLTVERHKSSMDDASIKSSRQGILQQRMATNLATKSPSYTTTTSGIESDEPSPPSESGSANKKWYHSPQVQHRFATHNPTNSPMSTGSYSSVENSTHSNDRSGVRSPTQSKRRPNSGLSRDSGYTSREHMTMIENQSLHQTVTEMRTRLRRSPTDPLVSSLQQKRISQNAPALPHPIAQPPTLVYTEAVKKRSLPRDFHYSTNRTVPDSYPQPRPSSADSINPPEVEYYEHSSSLQYPVRSYYGGHVQHPYVYHQPPQAYARRHNQSYNASGRGFINQLNSMSKKNSAKSAPLYVDEPGHQVENHIPYVSSGASTVGPSASVPTKARPRILSNSNYHHVPPPMRKPPHQGVGENGRRRKSAPFIPGQSVIEVAIHKPAVDGLLGITITGGARSPNLYRHGDPNVYVLNMAEQGAAYKSGKLRIGDHILKVNGVDLNGMTQDQAAGLLRQRVEIVYLLVLREMSETLL